MTDEYIGQIRDIILGRDFLTWLWFRSEVNGGRFETGEGQAYTLYLEQRISVQGGEGEDAETAVVSGPHSELREARLGVATGKKVNKALLRLECDPDEWRVALKAEDFTVHGLKTPQVEKAGEDDDPDAVFLEKIYLMERCMSFLDDVYGRFLRLRFGEEWREEAGKIRSWLEQGR